MTPNVYHKPCIKCGHTLRYCSSDKCVECSRNFNAVYRRTDRGIAGRRKYQKSAKYRFKAGVTNRRHRDYCGKWTEEAYQAALIEQCGKCALCGKPMLGDKDCARDHDHQTGKMRGLLHGNCNLLIEHVEKVGEVNVTDYLKKYAPTDGSGDFGPNEIVASSTLAGST